MIDIPLDKAQRDMAFDLLIPAIEAKPGIEVTLFMSAFDNDPREIYEIPEAREAWLDAATKLHGHKLVMTQESVDVITLCIAVEEGRSLTRDPNNPDIITIGPPSSSQTPPSQQE